MENWCQRATLKFRKMERAGRFLGNLTSVRKNLSVEELVAAAWPAAVGLKIVPWTKVAGMVRKSLVVHVEDVVWQRNLFGLRHHILSNLTKIVGEGVVNEIQFRIASTASIPRREPFDRARPGRLAPSRASFADQAAVLPIPLPSIAHARTEATVRPAIS